MIQHGDAEGCAGFFKLLGDGEILFAWLHVAGGVVVGQDNRRGPVCNGIGKNFARVDLGFVDQTDGDHARGDNLIGAV